MWCLQCKKLHFDEKDIANGSRVKDRHVISKYTVGIKVLESSESRHKQMDQQVSVQPSSWASLLYGTLSATEQKQYIFRDNVSPMKALMVKIEFKGYTLKKLKV